MNTISEKAAEDAAKAIAGSMWAVWDFLTDSGKDGYRQAARAALAAMAAQPKARLVARLVIVDKGGGFKAIRTWDDIGDLSPGEHFLFAGTPSAPQQPAPAVPEGMVPHWAVPAVENALSLLDSCGYMHTDLAAVRDWLKENAP